MKNVKTISMIMAVYNEQEMVTNLRYGTRLTEMYTCYTVAKAEHMTAILPRLTADDFSLEAEITALLAERT